MGNILLASPSGPYGTKEAFVAKPQARHLCTLHPDTHVEVFPGMNHGQFLIDHPEEVAERIISILERFYPLNE